MRYSPLTGNYARRWWQVGLRWCAPLSVVVVAVSTSAPAFAKARILWTEGHAERRVIAVAQYHGTTALAAENVKVEQRQVKAASEALAAAEAQGDPQAITAAKGDLSFAKQNLSELKATLYAAEHQHVVDAICVGVEPAVRVIYFAQFRCAVTIQDGRHGHLLVTVVDRKRFHYKWVG